MIDQLLVFSYLVGLLYITFKNRSTLSSFKGFTTISTEIKSSKLLLVATIFASSVGGATCFGISEKVYLGKMSYAYGLLITIVVDLLIAYFLVPKISKHYGAETVGDIMHRHYGNTGKIIAGIAGVMVSIGFVAAQINVCGLLFSYMFGIPNEIGIILSYSIIIAYTTIGGLKSVLFSNLLQFFSIIIAIPLLTIWGANKLSLEDILINVKFLSSHEHLFLSIMFAILNFSVMNLYPSLIQRTLLNASYKKTKNAIYLKSLIYAIILICIIINAILSYSYDPNLEAKYALLHLIKSIVPIGIQGIIVVGFLSAAMSTADADLNIASITLTKDILKPLLHITHSKKLLLLARITNVITGVITVIIALRFNSVLDLVLFTTGFWGPIILVPFVFALYHITITYKTLIYTSIIGFISFLLWAYFFSYLPLKPVFVGTLSSLITFLSFKYYINKYKHHYEAN